MLSYSHPTIGSIDTISSMDVPLSLANSALLWIVPWMGQGQMEA